MFNGSECVFALHSLIRTAFVISSCRRQNKFFLCILLYMHVSARASSNLTIRCHRPFQRWCMKTSFFLHCVRRLFYLTSVVVAMCITERKKLNHKKSMLIDFHRKFVNHMELFFYSTGNKFVQRIKINYRLDLAKKFPVPGRKRLIRNRQYKFFLFENDKKTKDNNSQCDGQKFFSTIWLVLSHSFSLDSNICSVWVWHSQIWLLLILFKSFTQDDSVRVQFQK